MKQFLGFDWASHSQETSIETTREGVLPAMVMAAELGNSIKGVINIRDIATNGVLGNAYLRTNKDAEAIFNIANPEETFIKLVGSDNTCLPNRIKGELLKEAKREAALRCEQIGIVLTVGRGNGGSYKLPNTGTPENNLQIAIALQVFGEVAEFYQERAAAVNEPELV
jgi:hypothetical protein